MNIKNTFHFLYTFLFFFFFPVPPNLFLCKDILGFFFLRAYVISSLPQVTPLVAAASLSQSPDSELAGCFLGSQPLLAWEVSMAHAGPRDPEG